MTRPIIFLDIDGVLTNFATKYRVGDPLCVACLNRITEATGAVIVVSSSWRGHPDIAGILSGWGVTGEVIGITPSLSHLRASGIAVSAQRGQEIYQWIVKNEFDGFCAILDDDKDMWPVMDRLVQTDTQLGLQDTDADKAIALLQPPGALWARA